MSGDGTRHSIAPLVVGSTGTKETSGFGGTGIRLDPVSVWIDDEGSVVIGAVYRAQTGRTVVMPARGQRRRVKRIDGGDLRSGKAKVQTGLFIGWSRVLGLDNPERDTVATIPVTQQRSRSAQALVSERLQRGVVETRASVDVPYPDRDVSDHGPLPKSAARPICYLSKQVIALRHPMSGTTIFRQCAERRIE
jgi:hypothetical protein